MMHAEEHVREKAVLVECGKILICMIASIRAKGHYSIETTMVILESALTCVPLAVRDEAFAQMRMDEATL